MKKYSVLILLFIINFSFSQIKDIELPEGKSKINYSNTNITKIHNIYITKDEKVFFEKTEVLIQQLGDTLFKYKLPFDSPFRLSFHLYANKKTKFEVIDAVKTQASSARAILCYRIGNITDLTQGTCWRNQAALTYRKEPEIFNNQVITQGDDVVVMPPEEHPITILQNELYAQNFDEALKLLKDFTYKKVTFIGHKKMQIDSKKIKLTNENEIFNEIKNCDFIFFESLPTITYGDYIKNILTLNEIFNANFEKHRGTTIGIPFIEISGELKMVLIKEGVKL